MDTNIDRVSDATELLVRPEAPDPTPLGHDMVLPFRNSVVAAHIKVVVSDTLYLNTHWLLCDATLVHEDGTSHELHWKSRTLPMAMQFIQALCVNYPGLTALDLAVSI